MHTEPPEPTVDAWASARKEPNMADTSIGNSRVASARSSVDDPQVYENVTGWTGWIGFAATMAVLIGFFHAMAGLVGIFKDEYYAVAKRDLIVSVDYTAWGWAHLAFGVLAIAVGFGMASGQMWARVVGVIFAVLSAVVNLAFLNASPVWSTTLIAFDVLVIWALTVHGREMKALN
jgi:vacuolar-type H+-ATPase subunit I/STV1